MFGRYVPSWDVLSRPWPNKPTFEQSQWFKGLKTLDLLDLFGFKNLVQFFFKHKYLLFDLILYVNIQTS